MDAVTYPHQAVSDEINEHFCAMKVSLMEKHPDFKELMATARVSWAPTFVYLDSRGKELRRRTGWLPAEEFLAELRFVRAFEQQQNGDFAGAREAMKAVAAEFEGAPIAPEALFWAGSATYMNSGRDMQALKEQWTELLEKYPDTSWATGASTIEDWEG